MMYNAKLSKDSNGKILATFPDVPAAMTFGQTHQEALEHARDALASALEMCVEDGQPLPARKFLKGHAVQLRVLHAAKLALHIAMRENKITKLGLSRLLGIHPPQVDRLLDFNRASRLDALEDALAAVGKKLVVRIEAA
jgi:antitoxin HicB